LSSKSIFTQVLCYLQLFVYQATRQVPILTAAILGFNFSSFHRRKVRLSKRSIVQAHTKGVAGPGPPVCCGVSLPALCPSDSFDRAAAKKCLLSHSYCFSELQVSIRPNEHTPGPDHRQGAQHILTTLGGDSAASFRGPPRDCDASCS
jgi:hypothetical protein